MYCHRRGAGTGVFLHAGLHRPHAGGGRNNVYRLRRVRSHGGLPFGYLRRRAFRGVYSGGAFGAAHAARGACFLPKRGHPLCRRRTGYRSGAGRAAARGGLHGRPRGDKSVPAWVRPVRLDARGRRRLPDRRGAALRGSIIPAARRRLAAPGAPFLRRGAAGAGRLWLARVRFFPQPARRVDAAGQHFRRFFLLESLYRRVAGGSQRRGRLFSEPLHALRIRRVHLPDAAVRRADRVRGGGRAIHGAKQRYVLTHAYRQIIPNVSHVLPPHIVFWADPHSQQFLFLCVCNR